MSDSSLNRFTNFVAVTPHDTTLLPNLTRALYIGGVGDVTCLNGAGTAILFKAVPTGTVLHIQTSRVNSTGTGATNILALY